MNLRKIEIILLGILVVMLPCHYMLFAVLLKEFSFLKLWRDILVFAIFVIEIIRSKGLKKDNSLVIASIFLCFCVVYIFLAPNIFKAINITRVYLIPLIIFQAVKNLEFKEEELRGFLKAVMISVAVYCIYGIFQAYVLGPTFLIQIGYDSKDGVLSSSYFLSNYGNSLVGRDVQRVVSTFSAANICAFYLSSIFIVFLTFREKLKVRRIVYNGFMFLVFITIFLTFSRSSWLAVAIAIIVFNFKSFWTFISSVWKQLSVMIVFALIALIFMPSLQNAIVHIFKSSFSGEDTSVISHQTTIQEAIKMIAKNPILGLGLGENGPRALNYGASNLVESSFYLMIFEYGIFGAVLYFCNYLYVVIKSITHRKYSKEWALSAVCLIAFTMLAFLNIPYVQEIECTAIVFVFLGIFSYNMDKEKSEEKKASKLKNDKI
ncbi:MAG: O-antigen ligase family protein [Oscillospiraceae bacterium]|nr:O-antigen ligase family protein [Oscillospiraceae bacterium]